MVPRCVAIIPDGNRRWAVKQKLPKLEGHRRGLINGRCIIQAGFEMGIRHMVIWGASESNLKTRSHEEVAHLFALLGNELRDRLRRADKVRFRLCGNWRAYTNDRVVCDAADMVHKKTESYHQHQLTVLFGYDGRQDVVQAAQQLFDKGVRPTEELIREHLWTAHLPDADFIIRTGVEGDPHDSDAFLPLQRHNAQLIYSNLCWPEFDESCFRASIGDFSDRERRMGS